MEETTSPQPLPPVIWGVMRDEFRRLLPRNVDARQIESAISQLLGNPTDHRGEHRELDFKVSSGVSVHVDAQSLVHSGDNSNPYCWRIVNVY